MLNYMLDEFFPSSFSRWSRKDEKDQMLRRARAAVGGAAAVAVNFKLKQKSRVFRRTLGCALRGLVGKHHGTGKRE